MNQPSAGFVNFRVLVESVVPVIAAAKDKNGKDSTDELIDQFMVRAKTLFEDKVDSVFRRKLGFSDHSEIADDLWISLKNLMKITRVDWTLFFRQLTVLAAEFEDSRNHDDDDELYDAMLQLLIADGGDDDYDDASPFYEPLTSDYRQQYLNWIIFQIK